MAVYALCDANNFYCSCERAFNPALRGVPSRRAPVKSCAHMA